MTDYLKPRFSVSQSGRSPEDCGDSHWMDKRGKCVFCGATVPPDDHESWLALQQLSFKACRTIMAKQRRTPSPPEPSE